LDPGATAADVGLDEDREAEGFRRRDRLLRPAQHPGRGVGDAEARHKRVLRRLRQLIAEGRCAVQDRRADIVEVLQVAQRVKDRLAPAAHPGRWAHAVDDEAVRHLALVRVVDVIGGVERDVRDAKPVELHEERLEPLGVLVQDRNRLLHQEPSLPADDHGHKRRVKRGPDVPGFGAYIAMAEG